jgi:hypothetical protein
MRVYHFIGQKWGLDDLRKQRLKIAIIDELNDPFELLGADLRDKELRRSLQQVKRQMSACSGFLCFSAKWMSPAQWAHYAERHRGFCFGFDIQARPKKISYRDTRVKISKERFLNPESISARDRDHLFYTKAKCWEYEDERRLLVGFENCVFDRGLYFVPFSEQLVLREVYVGALSDVTEAKLRKAMRGLEPSVEIIKVRSAFRSFTITRDRRWPPRWVIPRSKPLPAGTFAALDESAKGLR